MANSELKFVKEEEMDRSEMRMVDIYLDSKLKDFIYCGYFHAWTRDSDGEPSGIIEKKDGSITVEYAGCIVFHV